MALAAPALVRASSIMPVRDPKLVRGIIIHESGLREAANTPDHPYWPYTYDQAPKITWTSFEPLPEGRESLRHEVVWLHESDRRVVEFRQIERQSADIARPAYEISLEERAARPRPPWTISDVKRDRRRATNIDVTTAIRESLPKTYVITDGNVPLSPEFRNYAGSALPTSAYDPRYALDAA